MVFKISFAMISSALVMLNFEIFTCSSPIFFSSFTRLRIVSIKVAATSASRTIKAACSLIKREHSQPGGLQRQTGRVLKWLLSQQHTIPQLSSHRTLQQQYLLLHRHIPSG